MHQLLSSRVKWQMGLYLKYRLKTASIRVHPVHPKALSGYSCPLNNISVFVLFVVTILSVAQAMSTVSNRPVCGGDLFQPLDTEAPEVSETSFCNL